jgi:hypothetical protein
MTTKDIAVKWQQTSVPGPWPHVFFNRRCNWTSILMLFAKVFAALATLQLGLLCG